MDKLALTDFLNYRFLSDLRFSPDGKHIALFVHQTNLDENGYNSDVWLADTETRGTQRLTRDGGSAAFWWHDNSHIAYYRKAPLSKSTTIYTIDINNGEEKVLVSVPLKVERIEKITKDRYILLALHHLEDSHCPPQTEPWEETDDGYIIYDELPFIENVRGNVNKTRRCLYLFENGIITPLSDPWFEVESFRADPDGSRVVYFGSSYKTLRGQKHDVLLYDIIANSHSKLFEGQLVQDVAFWREKVLVISSDMQTYGLYQCPSWYVVDVTTLEIQKLGDSLYAMTNGTSTDITYGGGQSLCVSNEAFFYIATVNNYSQILKTDCEGTTMAITPLDGAVECFDLSAGKLAYIGLKGQQLTELYTAEADGTCEQQIGCFNNYLVNKHVVKPQPISFTNSCGLVIDGWVLVPVGYEKGRKYPGILNIHGGPKGVYSPIFFHEMQLWANEGYFVFFSNPSGSTGRGDEFTDLRGKYGTVDYNDLMEFTDAVLQQYRDIDTCRLGVAGGSYGGFMVNWIIGHTKRFRAAASLRSISNWISDFGTADIGYFFNVDEHGGDPWVNFENIWKMSPLKYADQVTTPTLFVHSNEDFRCPLEEAYQMYTALMYHGVQSRLVVFKGENHHLSRTGKPRNRITRMKEILHWFNQHLMVSDDPEGL